MEKILEMKDIVKDFGDFRAVDHVNFSMETGEIVALGRRAPERVRCCGVSMV
mgnify:CR=1 FL=1